MPSDIFENLRSVAKLETDGTARTELDRIALPQIKRLANAHGSYGAGLRAIELVRLLHNGALKFEGNRLVAAR